MRSSHLVGRPSGRAVAASIRQGAYLTDGADLFRVVAVVSGSSGPKMVELEDCRTLAVRSHSGTGFLALGLRPVRATPAGGAGSGEAPYSARSTSAT